MAAWALTEDGLRFALAGSYALWVHGAPEPQHDVDFVVAEDDVRSAENALDRHGFQIEHRPEGWLFKAHRGDGTVDVLFRLNGIPVDADLLAGATAYEVLAVTMAVLPPTAVITQKLLALNEHHCDFGTMLPAVRAVREQLDWPSIRTRTGHNDFAVAFLALADRLGLTRC